jgi:hypothetical protein
MGVGLSVLTERSMVRLHQDQGQLHSLDSTVSGATRAYRVSIHPPLGEAAACVRDGLRRYGREVERGFPDGQRLYVIKPATPLITDRVTVVTN